MSARASEQRIVFKFTREQARVLADDFAAAVSAGDELILLEADDIGAHVVRIEALR